MLPGCARRHSRHHCGRGGIDSMWAKVAHVWLNGWQHGRYVEGTPGNRYGGPQQTIYIHLLLESFFVLKRAGLLPHFFFLVSGRRNSVIDLVFLPRERTDVTSGQRGIVFRRHNHSNKHVKNPWEQRFTVAIYGAWEWATDNDTIMHMVQICIYHCTIFI